MRDTAHAFTASGSPLGSYSLAHLSSSPSALDCTGEYPVFWISGYGQGLLLLGHYRSAHTSSLRLSLHADRHCSSLPSFALWWAFPTSDYYEGSAL